MLAPAFPNPDERLDEIRYLDGLYDRMLPALAVRLNTLHGTNHSVRFWEMSLCSWLQVYLHILRDRYVRIEKAARVSLPNKLVVQANDLEPSNNRDYPDFVHEWTMDDRISMAVYGEIARHMGITVEPVTSKLLGFTQNKPIFLPQHLPEPTAPSLPSKISHPGGCVLASTLHEPMDLAFLHRELGISKFVPGCMEITWQDIDRNLLENWFEARDKFEQIAADMLPNHLPTSVIEEFDGLLREADKFSGFEVYHSGSWHSEGAL